MGGIDTANVRPFLAVFWGVARALGANRTRQDRKWVEKR